MDCRLGSAFAAFRLSINQQGHDRFRAAWDGVPWQAMIELHELDFIQFRQVVFDRVASFATNSTATTCISNPFVKTRLRKGRTQARMGCFTQSREGGALTKICCNGPADAAP
ncbi:MAG: hypothetical protein E5V66_11430 [Mesorhizobium sp.]|uniref:hypothetical protein n=1 Tax=Mesorhizobium sp. TaxID=1871066 RepID=UPI000FCB0FD7|nr:hypothetical protein [Mesorhizobium sp.]RUW83234.1 hypothetical protein EOA29_14285 [Mesorhizobium sp. M1E.F.Ca.ET.063.01.1.1]TIW11891.1 MAG: hypothetical protein E5V66_11430 [Mesorhizobium sp.]